MRILKVYKVLFLVFTSIVIFSSCSKNSKVVFQHEDLEITYVYRVQIFLLDDLHSIKRKVKIIDKNTNQKVRFKLIEDIESFDEARFFIYNDIEYKGKKYSKTLVIRDPFAFVIIDLLTFQIIYNSHGEDLGDEKYMNNKFGTCIGKVRGKKFIKENCKIEFLK